MCFKSISVIGLGYIGLPTAAIFASSGIMTIGVDINETIVDIVNNKKIHIVEPDLDKMVHDVVAGGFLRATTIPEPADAFLIAVPTPFKEVGHTPDLRFIEKAAKAIAPVLKKGDLIILESTSPVGTTEQLSNWLASERPDLSFPQTHGEGSDIRIAYCPERVLPGQVLQELVQNDRIIGGMTPKCSAVSSALYKVFVQGECLETNSRTAEMAKLTENSFRDVNIAFANELSIISDKLEINVWELIALSNRHPRVNILQPGPGVGGHCIAVDPWFIVSATPNEAQLIKAAREINDAKPEWVIDKVKTAIADYLQQNPSKTISDIIIACFGLAFKPNIDDLRESPALVIADTLSEMHGLTVLAVEPNVTKLPVRKTSLTLVSAEMAIEKADIFLILVNHQQFIDIKTFIPSNAKVLDISGLLR